MGLGSKVQLLRLVWDFRIPALRFMVQGLKKAKEVPIVDTRTIRIFESRTAGLRFQIQGHWIAQPGFL